MGFDCGIDLGTALGFGWRSGLFGLGSGSGTGLGLNLGRGLGWGLVQVPVCTEHHRQTLWNSVLCLSPEQHLMQTPVSWETLCTPMERHFSRPAVTSACVTMGRSAASLAVTWTWCSRVRTVRFPVRCRFQENAVKSGCVMHRPRSACWGASPWQVSSWYLQ